jgi:hypothetical protein
MFYKELRPDYGVLMRQRCELFAFLAIRRLDQMPERTSNPVEPTVSLRPLAARPSLNQQVLTAQ